MKISVIKKNDQGVAVSSGTLTVADFEQFIKFTVAMGVNQTMDEFVLDFQEGQDRTYVVQFDTLNG